MANWWQIRLLKWSVKGWNFWKSKHPNLVVDLSKANLREADLANADLQGADLRGADLSKASLTAEVRVYSLSESRSGKIPELSIDLLSVSQAGGIDIQAARYYGASLGGADLSEADLIGANLSGINLSQANLRGTNLSQANLRGTNLSQADLTGARLIGAILEGTNLSQADLNLAYLGRTILADIDFLTVKGLAQIYHISPSPIHLPSLRLPQDGSALHFLRGVGLTNEQIDTWRSTAILPIQYHSVFISYSSKDKILADRLHADLQDRGVRCWFASEDLKIGNKIRDRIDQAIQVQDKLLLLLSEHALASTWVEDEVEAALEKERRQQREVLFPVRLDESVMQTMQPWAAKLRRTRHIGDFTRWTDPKEYQQAFERLLRDLKADTRQ